MDGDKKIDRQTKIQMDSQKKDRQIERKKRWIDREKIYIFIVIKYIVVVEKDIKL